MNHSFHSAHWKHSMNKPLISVVSGGILFFYPQHLFATPTEGTVANGSATISQNGLATVINQGSARAVIDWRGFDISADERVQFIQANASAIALNRITGGNPTTILGQLAANGRVFISNPNGVVFGAGSRVDVAGLLATTLSINADEFMNGKTLFTKSLEHEPSFVVNQGEIHVAENGFCFLVAGGVQNAGTIIGQLGKVVLASADTLTLDFNGDGLVTYTVSGKVLQNIIGPDGKPFEAGVSNTGTITAPGGDIVMVGNGAKDAFSSVVNNSGVLEATSLNVKNGSVTLNAGDGDAVVTGSINVSGTGAGQVGGKVEVLGNRVGLFGNAAIDASGAAGGGTVLVGGDLHGQGGVPTASQTVVGASATIKANAIDAGDGGKVVVWADNSTSFNGTIEARGGTAGGNGGFVETSGKQTLAFNGNVDTRAPQGLTGTLLLDPTDITISDSASTGTMTNTSFTFSDTTASTSNLNTTILVNALNSSSVIVDTNLGALDGTGTITVSNAFSWANANSLTLKAKSTLTTNATITNSGAGALNFYADGAVSVNAAVLLTEGAFTVAGYSGSGSAASFTNSGVSITTGGGAVNIATSGGITVGTINAGAGAVNLTATSGAITSSSSSITAGALTLSGTTIGANDNKINTAVSSITATGAGGIFLSNTGAIAVNTINASSAAVSLTATGAITDNNAEGNNITAGALTLSGSSLGASSNAIETTVSSIAATTTGGGIYLANTGALSPLAASSSGGNITISSSEDIAVGLVNAGSGAVSLTAKVGNITATSTDTAVSLITGGTIGLEIKSGLDPTLTSQVGSYLLHNIGTSSSAPLNTHATNLTVTAEFGSIYLNDTNTSVTINSIAAQFKGNAATVNAITGAVDAKAVDGSSRTSALSVDIATAGDVTLGTVTAPDDVKIVAAGQIQDGNSYNNNITASSVTLRGTAIGTQPDVVSETPANAIEILSPAITTAKASTGNIYLALGTKSTLGTSTGTDTGTITATAGDIGISITTGDLTIGGNITAGGDDVTIVTSAGKMLSSSSSFKIDSDHVTLAARDGIGTDSASICTTATSLATEVAIVNALTYVSSDNTLASITTKSNNGLVTISGLGSTGLWLAAGTPKILSAKAATALSFENTGGGIFLGTINGGSGTISLTASGAITGNASTELTAGTATLNATIIGDAGGAGAIKVPVTTLSATATAGGVYLVNSTAGAMTLTASAAGSDKDIEVTTGGALILKSITAPDAVTLTATGAITDGNGATSTAANITAATATLSAASIGTSATDKVDTSVSTLGATATSGDIFITNNKAMTLTAAANTAAKTIDINNSGNLILKDVTATGGTVKLTATGAMSDGNDAAPDTTTSINITASTANLAASGIGTLTNRIETSIGTLNATTSSSGIYIKNSGNGLNLTAEAKGSGSNIDIDNSTLAIDVEIVTAEGDAVTLKTEGGITDGNGANVNNITAKSLKLDAASVAPDLGLSVSEISGNGTTEMTLTNDQPLYLTASALTGGGTYTAPSITIIDLGNTSNFSDSSLAGYDPTTIANVNGTANTVTASHSLVLQTLSGNIVFLDTLDTIQTTVSGLIITMDAGSTTLGSGAVAIIGNLKTNDGAISVKADNHISIGLLDAGSANVRVQSITGMILDGNGDALNIKAGSVDLLATTPSEHNANIHTMQSVANASAAAGDASTDTNTYNSSLSTSLSDAEALADAKAVAVQETSDVATAEGKFTTADTTASQAELAAQILSDTAAALGIVADVAELVAAGAQIIPLVGDGGGSMAFTILKLAGTVANAAALVSTEVAGALRTTADGLEADLTYKQTVLDNGLGAVDHAQYHSDLSAEKLSTDTNIMQQSLVASAALNLVEAQALTADKHIEVPTVDSDGNIGLADHYSANAIGNPGNPLGIDASGRVNITAGKSNVYLKATDTIELGTISASQNRVLGPSVVLVTGATDVTVSGTVSATNLVRIDASGSITEVGGNTGIIMAANFIANAGTGIGNGSTTPLKTSITNFAANGGNGEVSIVNDKALNITSVIDNSNIDEGAGTYGPGTAVTGVTASGGTSDISTTTGLLTVAQAVSTGTGAIILKGTAGVTHTATGDLTTSGTISVTALTNDVTMADGTVYSSGGQVDLVAATNAVLGQITTGSTGCAVNVTASTGAITDTTSSSEAPNITTTGTATLSAATGIGASGVADIDTAIGTLIATNGTSGNIFVQESSGLTIGGAGVRTLAGDGSINIDVVDGYLTVDSVVTANGLGSVTLSSAGLLTANAAISSSTGNLSLTGGTGVTHTAAGDLTTTGAGTISVTATANDITMADGTVYSTGTGLVNLTAARHVLLGQINTTSSNVNVTATSGAITDNTSSEDPNITTSGTATLSAATGIGISGSGDIDTTIGTLAATNSTSGDIFVQESSGLIIGGSGVRTQGATGHINIDVDAGNLAVNSVVTAYGSGNILLNAAGSITASADVTSTSGNISVLAGQDVTFTTNADIRTSSTSATTGTINVEAGTGGSITMDPTSLFTTSDTFGDIRLHANNNVIVGDIATTEGDVSITAVTGSITDADILADPLVNDSNLNITASGLRLWAGVGIGETVDHLETTVGTVSARATSGGIYLLETNDVTVDNVSVTTNKVGTDGTTTNTNSSDAAQSDLVTTSGGGNIVLRTSNGNITLNDGTAVDHTAISANGSGNVLVQATGAGTSLTGNEDVKSDTGNITLLAAQAVTFTGGASVVTGGGAVAKTGTIDIEAGTGITMSTTSNTTSANGDIRMLAANNINVGGQISTAGSVNITATTGSIIDNDGENATVDIVANGLRLWAGTGIGVSGNPIETTVTTVSARTTDANINILESNVLIVGDTSTTVYAVQTDGTATGATTETQSNITTTTGDVNLVAGGTIGLGRIVSTSGDVNVTSTSGAITNNTSPADGNIVTTGLMTLVAGNGIGSASSALHIDAVELNASTSGTTMYINDIAGGVALGLVTTGGTSSGEVNLTATNGSITESGDDAGVEIVGNTVNLVVTGAGSTIGTATNMLEIDATLLNAQSDGGNMYINDIAGGVAVGLVTTGGTSSGEVNLTATNGSITESGNDAAADVVGNTVNLVVTGAGNTIGEAANTLEIDAAVLNAQTDAGNISLNDIAGGVALGLVTTGGTSSGEVNLTATNGSITESGDDAAADVISNTLNLVVTGAGSTIGAANVLEIDTALLNAQSDGGNISLNDIAGGVALGLVTTGGTSSGEVNLTATNGNITESGDDAGAEIVGNTVNLVVTGAGSTIGTATNMLEIDAAVLNAQTDGSNMYLNDIAGGVALGLVTTGSTASGEVNLTATDGSIAESGDDAAADVIGNTLNLVVTGAGSSIGEVANMLEIDTALLNAQSDGGNISLNDIAGGVTLGLVTTGGTTSGEVSLTATDGSITESGDDAGAEIIGNTVNLVVTGAGSTIGTAANSLEIDTALLNAQSDGGNMYINDIAGGVALGLVTTGGTTLGEVNLTATDGSITESGDDAGAEIIGNTLNLVVTGAGTIGTAGNTLEIDAEVLNARSEGGGIYLHDIAGGVAVGLIDAGGTGGGDVTLLATDGSITESGSDAAADIVGKSVNVAINGTPDNGLGSFENILEINSPNVSIDNPDGNTYIDLNNGVGADFTPYQSLGMLYNNSNFPEVIIYGNKIQGGDRIDELITAQSEITLLEQTVIPRHLILVSAERLASGSLTLNNNVVF